MTPLRAKSRPADSRDAFNSATASPRSLTILIFAIVLLLNLLFLTKNYYWDGVFFAQVIEDARGINAALIHPSHLYDQLFLYLIYRGVILAGIHARALTVFQITNCFLSAAAAVAFFKICTPLFKSIYVSMIATALFAFSATWWKFSTDANVYVLAVLLLLICFRFLLPEREPRPFLAAIIHASAMLIHQLSLFFFPVVLVGILLQTRGLSRKERVVNAVKYGLTVTVITLLAYYATFRAIFGPSSASHFVSWITYFSPEHGFTFSLWGNFVYSFRSQLRALIGGRVAFIREFSNVWIYALTAITVTLTLACLVKTVRHFDALKGTVTVSVKRFRPLVTVC